MASTITGYSQEKDWLLGGFFLQHIHNYGTAADSQSEFTYEAIDIPDGTYQAYIEPVSEADKIYRITITEDSTGHNLSGKVFYTVLAIRNPISLEIMQSQPLIGFQHGLLFIKNAYTDKKGIFYSPTFAIANNNQ